MDCRSHAVPSGPLTRSILSFVVNSSMFTAMYPTTIEIGAMT